MDKIKFGFASLLFLIVSCTSLKYVDDKYFLVAAQANSPEFPVSINGKKCADVDGIPGLCTKRVKSNTSIFIRHDARPYAYRFDLRCTKELGESQTFNVLKDSKFEYEIKPEKFLNLTSFICVGEIFPTDREEAVSASWKLFANVVDEKYVSREVLQFQESKGKLFLVFGQHSLYAMVDGKAYKEKTMIEVKSRNVKAYSESHNMRFNSVGL